MPLCYNTCTLGRLFFSFGPRRGQLARPAASPPASGRNSRHALETKGFSMRLAFTADLHGNLNAYQNLFALAQEAQAEAVIVGGDLLPHTIKIAEAVQMQQQFIREELQPLLTAFRAAQPETAIYLLAGNDDWAAAVTLLKGLEATGLAHPLHERVFKLAPDLWLAGYGCVPLTPFSIKDYERLDDDLIHKQGLPTYSFAMAYVSSSGEPRKTSLAAIMRKPTISNDLALLARSSLAARTIYVTHTPPYQTVLDMTHRREKHLGSRALRSFITQHQPLLTLHGHIHESPQISGQYATQIGATWAVNPGHDDRRFSAITLDTDDLPNSLWHTIYGKFA